MAGDYLVHHGILGQKKHVRRWQYKDGSLTPEGYEHYGITPPWERRNSAFEAYVKKHSGEKNADGTPKTREQLGADFNKMHDQWYDPATGKITEATKREDYELIRKQNEYNTLLKNYDDAHKGPDRAQQAQTLTTRISDGTRVTGDLVRTMEKQSINELPNGTKKSGYEKTMEALAVIGGIASVTGAVIGIAAAIKDLRDD